MNEQRDTIDNEARAALAAAGEGFLAQLNTMRSEVTGPDEIEPLDANAELALRKRGDELLDELATKRAELKPRRRWRRRVIEIAAVLAVGFALLKLSAPPKPEPVVLMPAPVQEEMAEGQGMAAVPEPGTGVLALMGGVMFVLRRRR